MHQALAAISLGLLIGFHPLALAAAEPVQAVELRPAKTSTGVVAVVRGADRRDVTIAEIETLPMVRIDTRTPWDEGVFRFEGVLLADFLDWVGAKDAPSITVRGLDGYSAVIPRADWTTWPIVLVTRQDGQPLDVRRRGPARIVYPVDQFPELNAGEYANRAVWLIAEIAG